jgi:hypothetical protein
MTRVQADEAMLAKRYCAHTQSAPARAQLLLHFAASSHLSPPSPHFFFVFLLHLAIVLLILVFFLRLCVPRIYFLCCEQFGS